MAHPELDFFSNLNGKLKIELDTPPVRVGQLLNVRAEPHAKIVRVEFEADVYLHESESCRPLTEEELDSIAYRGPTIRLQSGEGGDPIKFPAPNGESFTVRELMKAVEETERQSRDQSEWAGGIDVHHVYFEGLEPCEEDEDVWEIQWGS